MSDVVATTKTCPFCAETIQAAAIVCRYCGRDLTANAQPPMPAAPMVSADDRTLVQQEVARLTGQGWQIVSQTEVSVQLKKPKEWNRAGVVLLVFLPLLGALFYGPLIYAAILGLLLIVADYLVKKEQLVFIDAAHLKQRGTINPDAPAQKVPGDAPNTWKCSRCGRALNPQAEGCAFCKQRF